MTQTARWTPLHELDGIERRMRRMLDDVGIAPAPLPAADVYETKDEFVVELEVPGYDESELGIEVSDHTLTVTGERHDPAEQTQKTFRLRERLEHAFERRFQLPLETDSKRVTAVFTKGVLELHAPKLQMAKPRKVEIAKR